mmetsp:Transcript_32878/g.51603  ORF Transcript_32878/g.51603 Transcript_32878/m.51603 type:complete len:419 (+) Transcript_32878:113-1369(+)
MLDMGFEPDIRRVVERCGMPRERNTFMFSATFPDSIQRIARSFMQDYVFISIGRVGAAAADVSQTVMYTDEHSKTLTLQKILREHYSEGKILVFTKTKKKADQLETVLGRRGTPVVSIHGDKNQQAREQALDAFRQGSVSVLVATDVAARGLDIQGISLVVNYDLPTSIDDYVHRIGRTGRAGNIGKALSFFNDDTNFMIGQDLLKLLAENGQKIPDFLEKVYGENAPKQHNQGHIGFGASDYRSSAAVANRYMSKNSEPDGHRGRNHHDGSDGEEEDFYASLDLPSGNNNNDDDVRLQQARYEELQQHGGGWNAAQQNASLNQGGWMSGIASQPSQQRVQTSQQAHQQHHHDSARQKQQQQQQGRGWNLPKSNNQQLATLQQAQHQQVYDTNGQQVQRQEGQNRSQQWGQSRGSSDW